jgi:transposase-like protein
MDIKVHGYQQIQPYRHIQKHSSLFKAYSKTFQFIHNSRQIDSREEIFKQILWYK